MFLRYRSRGGGGRGPWGGGGGGPFGRGPWGGGGGGGRGGGGPYGGGGGGGGPPRSPIPRATSSRPARDSCTCPTRTPATPSAAACARQLARRDVELADGAHQVGWKIGFNTPAIQQAFGLSDPVVGYLLDRGVTTDGATVSLDGWTAPAVEVEVAVRVGDDGGVAGLAPALELVDLDISFDDIEPVLANNICQRGVVFGDEVPGVDPWAVVANVDPGPGRRRWRRRATRLSWSPREVASARTQPRRWISSGPSWPPTGHPSSRAIASSQVRLFLRSRWRRVTHWTWTSGHSADCPCASPAEPEPAEDHAATVAMWLTHG